MDGGGADKRDCAGADKEVCPGTWSDSQIRHLECDNREGENEKMVSSPPIMLP